MARVLLLIVALSGAVACRSAGPPALAVPLITVDIPIAANVGDATPLADRTCDTCGTSPLGSEVALAVEKRLAELKARGGHCSSYAAVLESSYRSGQITIRPFMWRVGSQLASGEAKPSGEMILAREIDSLNVGVRTLDDLLWSLEHEAAHIAFKISNGFDATYDRANEYVRACRQEAEAGVRR